MGAGKTMVARILCALYPGEEIRVVPFAAGVKREVAAHLSMTVEQVESAKRSSGLFRAQIPTGSGVYEFSMRQWLQWWGTEYRRAQDPEYWLKAWVASLPAGNITVICDDVRFVNESELIRALGGKVCVINHHDKNLATCDHASEQEIQCIDADMVSSPAYGILNMVEVARNIKAKCNI